MRIMFFLVVCFMFSQCSCEVIGQVKQNRLVEPALFFYMNIGATPRELGLIYSYHVGSVQLMRAYFIQKKKIESVLLYVMVQMYISYLEYLQKVYLGKQINNIVFGNKNKIKGSKNVVIGSDYQVTGNNNTILVGSNALSKYIVTGSNYLRVDCFDIQRTNIKDILKDPSLVITVLH